ncbi:hypothetical protein Leryth_004900 [Lithospermum erythrorhizon]|uniref:Bidirectional sugar transporter SWEET n=1 Tax=Lithospermum erythrorhizon TaxID=34254 RepID=A0AAV3NL85_LITER|nr:hypothetical protein Leryth_004900 [Lithospermum erythrorhizon]
MAFLTAANMAFVCGILGNIVSFLVYLAPLPTFYRIVKKKSTEGFQSIPYSVALFSAMLYLYYAFLKGNALMLITINCVGSAIETTYLIIFMIYATKTAKILTAKLLILFNFGALGVIIGFTYMLANGKQRLSIVGWICAVFSVCVFAAPLSIMRRVIKTKSVEFMPFNLSIFLTLCAVMWFFYGLLIKDYFIATPNVLGFTFGIGQMILYAIYRNGKKQILPEVQVQQLHDAVKEVTTLEKQNKFEVEAELPNHPQNDECYIHTKSTSNNIKNEEGEVAVKEQDVTNNV